MLKPPSKDSVSATLPFRYADIRVVWGLNFHVSPETNASTGPSRVPRTLRIWMHHRQHRREPMSWAAPVHPTAAP